MFKINFGSLISILGLRVGATGGTLSHTLCKPKSGLQGKKKVVSVRIADLKFFDILKNNLLQKL